MGRLVISNEVFSYIKPTIVAMKLFGLAPIIYKSEGGYYSFEKSTNYILYSYTIAIALGTWAFLGLWSDATSETSFRVKNAADIYVTLSDIGGVILSVLTGIFLSPFKAKSLFNIIEYLDRLNKIMKEPESNLVHDKTVTKKIVIVVYTVTFGVIILELYSWSERTPSSNMSFLYLRNYFCFYLFYVVLITQQMSFLNMTYFIKKRVMYFNYVMENEIRKRAVINNCTGNRVLWELGKGDKLENYLRNCVKTNDTSTSTRKEVGKFLKIHQEISNCFSAINEYFNYPLLFIMITCFVHQIITIWGILVSHYTRKLFLAMNIVWIVIQAGRLLLVVEPSHSCLVEVAKMNPLFVKLLTRVEERHIRQKLKILARRGKFCVFQFTAAKIVNIQRSVLATITGAVTTYLVILYQFHNQSRVN